ncbi:PREDICTED: wall-associated receptor kinase-like 14 [Ipomoea nil]|uniref:wall-associated receptor kinase-like 14 n=1 Tax=Ipomoea nil TaxID=35883 RepID=UPI000901EB9E|nr:PREDICTED: wall-associated receptor kinase-like 14 [Ipomoea nil]
MGFRRLILGVVFCNMVLSAGANSLMKCDRFCKSAGYHEEVPYPFGFSEGCGIRLNCRDHGDIRIGDFPVMNLTSKTILVSVPGNCSRSVENLRGLNGRNFAVAWWNVILLSNCVKPLTDCAPPASLVNTRFVKGDCDLKSERVSCYSESRGDDDFLDLERLKRRNCSVALSSLAVDFGTGKIPGLSLRFHTAELVWWLEGKCRCHVNAGCVSVRLPDGRYGFRCKCNDGFVGDGFADGDGCRRGPNCNFKNFMQGKCGEKRVIILIGGLAAGACGVVVLLNLLCCCIRRRSAFLKKRYAAMRFLSEAAGGSGVPCIPYKEIERATDGFSEKKMLGSGAYGTVYAAKLRSFGRVAIKKLKCHGPNGVEHVMNEIKLISSVRHPNLVQLIGCCVENDEQILVYEFMPNGTLFQHLHRVQGSGLSWEMRLNIATETARAIAHLHSAMSPPIYHRDIKSSNILLDLNCNSKVADFGLSRFGRADESHISTVPRGTPGYLDPHYHQNYHLTDKSDVYSFGVVLVEIITAKKVVDFSRPPSEINLSAVAVDRIAKGLLYEIIDPFLEPHRDAWTLSSIHRVAELAFTCLAFDKDMRPSMIEVAEELEQNRQSGQPPADGILSKVSSRSSSRSSWACGSEKSTRALSNRVLGSRRLILSQRVGSALSTMEVIDDASPVSVHDPWLREESSQSAVTLLDHLARST